RRSRGVVRLVLDPRGGARLPGRAAAPFPQAPRVRLTQGREPMSTSFPTLFSPLTLRHKTVKNRIVSTAHVTIFAEDGMPQERYRRYYLEKAKGGAGLLICFGSSSVHPTSPSLDWHTVELWDDRVIPHLQKFSGTMHEHDTVLLCQITHRGRRGH